MIEARQFVEAARERGFDWYAGVPCSYLTPFINYVSQDPSLHYVSMANEGDAVALIAGVALAGKRGITMMQNSGLGNAVSPLTSLTWTFRLPQLLIVTWRGQPGVADEPQHALMGPITPALLDTMEIPWELFPTEAEAIAPALERATAYMDTTGRPYALVMQKGSVAAYALKSEFEPTPEAKLPPAHEAAPKSALEPAALGATLEVGAGARAEAGTAAHSARSVPGVVSHMLDLEPASRPSRHEVLQRVVAQTPPASTVVLASTGFCGRELYAIDDRPNQLYMVGSMGCVVPFALGLALARPDLRVVALDGDGAALMRMGVFATVGAYGPPNLRHLLLDNGAHDSTGGQATVSSQISFGGVAAACGYAAALETDQVDHISAWLDAPPLAGPRFARLLTRTGTPDDLPRPSITPVEVKTRLMQHLSLT
jgi:phosphonopyruvate decarboxylase